MSAETGFAGADPKPGGGIVWRLLLGCLIVVLASAGATAVFILEQVHTVVEDLRANKPLKVDRKVLAHDYYGGPERQARLLAALEAGRAESTASTAGAAPPGSTP